MFKKIDLDILNEDQIFKIKKKALFRRFILMWIAILAIGLLLFSYYGPSQNLLMIPFALIGAFLAGFNAVAIESRFKLTKYDLKWYSRNLRSKLFFKGGVPYEPGNKK